MLQKKIAIIIQARMNSSRLPGKVLLNYKEFTPLSILIKRLKKSKLNKFILIATTKNIKDKPIINFCKKENLPYFKGSENNVLSRYYYAARKFKIRNIIRITSDCPLIDYETLDSMIKIFFKKKPSYYANTCPLPTKYPDGMDIEIFSYNTLKRTFLAANLPSEKEHVTHYMWKYSKFNILKKNLKKDLSKYRFCIDYKNDFKFLKYIINHFNKKIYSLKLKDLVNFVKKRPEIIKYQKKILRNEGWKKALEKDKIYKKKYL
jgi:spore coat polysaccharide biosynthesis protein SpsF